MRTSLFIPCLFVITSLVSGEPFSRQEVYSPKGPPVIDRIDSIVVYSDNSFPNERIFKSLGELSVHIDSLNRRTHAYQEENKRLHAITHDLVSIQNERDSLKLVAEKEAEVNMRIQKWQHSLFFFVLAIFASLVASGIVIAYHNRKKDA